MTICKGMRVEWRSTGDRRPFVFFRGTVVSLPTKGKWLGRALIDDGSGMNPRAVDVSKLCAIKPSARFASLGGGATA